MRTRTETGPGGPDLLTRQLRPRQLALRIAPCLLLGVIASAAVVLEIEGWIATDVEAGGDCGTYHGVSSGQCPRGAAGVWGVAGLLGLLALGLCLRLLIRKDWLRRPVLAFGTAVSIAAGAALGLPTGQWLWGVLHGPTVPVAWAAPADGPPPLAAVGAWASGDSLIEARGGQVVSYDPATGARRWTLTMPGIDVVCGTSGAESADGIALVLYGGDQTACDYVLAVDAASGRRLWSESIVGASLGNPAADSAAVADGTAILLTDAGLTGLSGASGAPRWAVPAPAGCGYQQFAAAAGRVVALAGCDTGYQLLGVDPADGAVSWRYQRSEPDTSFHVQLLSASPVVLSDVVGGPEPASTVRVFGPRGTETSHFSAAGIQLDDETTAGLDLAPGGLFAPPLVVTDGLLIAAVGPHGGETALACYRLSDGAQRWLADTPDPVHELALRGGEIDFVDESRPVFTLDRLTIATGAISRLGLLGAGVLQPGRSGLYAFDGDDLIVNTTGAGSVRPPVAALSVPAG